MRSIRSYLAIATLVIALPALAADKPPTTAAQAARLQFVPGPHDPSGGNGADWTALVRLFPAAPFLAVMAHASVGDTFPVHEEHKPTLFDVILIAGDDARLTLEVSSEKGARRYDLKRDDEVPVQVAGHKYTLLYPSVTVSSDSKHTTDKATIIVQRLP
jgi:hypothetical protein